MHVFFAGQKSAESADLTNRSDWVRRLPLAAWDSAVRSVLYQTHAIERLSVHDFELPHIDLIFHIPLELAPQAWHLPPEFPALLRKDQFVTTRALEEGVG